MWCRWLILSPHHFDDLVRLCSGEKSEPELCKISFQEGKHQEIQRLERVGAVRFKKEHVSVPLFTLFRELIAMVVTLPLPMPMLMLKNLAMFAARIPLDLALLSLRGNPFPTSGH
jgi:hypothetical protein